jgi:hypothetical protein
MTVNAKELLIEIDVKGAVWEGSKLVSNGEYSFKE